MYSEYFGNRQERFKRVSMLYNHTRLAGNRKNYENEADSVFST